MLNLEEAIEVLKKTCKSKEINEIKLFENVLLKPNSKNMKLKDHIAGLSDHNSRLDITGTIYIEI